jgi:hypothetical protein
MPATRIGKNIEATIAAIERARKFRMGYSRMAQAAGSSNVRI